MLTTGSDSSPISDLTITHDSINYGGMSVIIEGQAEKAEGFQNPHRPDGLLVRALIEERPDLFGQCPDEVQKVVRLLYDAGALQAAQRFPESLKLLNQAARILIPDKIKK